MSLKEDINFSIWCDFIERDFIEGEFKELIDDGIIHGATSNPAIFEQSIKNSPAYKQQLEILQNNEAKKIYEDLALSDIKNAAKVLKPLHSKDSDDGFISIEVDPTLCDDLEATIQEGKRLYKNLASENVMIKIPATEAGYEAMKELSSQGININATLIFSPSQAVKCALALNEGMKKTNKDVKAVISIFVSRFDRMCDNDLKSKGLEAGKLGIINAIKCYYEISKFKNKNIRTLFASTGVKGDDLEPSYYVDKLLIPNTINTAPLNTIKAWVKDGVKEAPDMEYSEDDCDEYFIELKKNGVDLENVYTRLLEDGIDAFKVSFKEMLKIIKE
ncbi:MAG: transaldolase [Sphaerochaetaceae bacterium]|nr:transaldolase [Sphaerochaetaceae bacterium]